MVAPTGRSSARYGLARWGDFGWADVESAVTPDADFVAPRGPNRARVVGLFVVLVVIVLCGD